MKKVFALLYACSLCVSFAGCGGQGESQSVVEGADQSAVEAYEAAIAAEEAAMNEDPPEDGAE